MADQASPNPTLRKGGRPSKWSVSTSAIVGHAPSPVDPVSLAKAHAAAASGDPADLMLTLYELVETSRHQEAGIVARAALDANQAKLPGISTARLMCLAIGASVTARADLIIDLRGIATEVRLSSSMFEMGRQQTSLRAHPVDLDKSVNIALAEANVLADGLDQIADGKAVTMTRVITALSRFGLLQLAKNLIDTFTVETTCSGLAVAHAAATRRHYGPARGLAANLEIIGEEPWNIAARTSACACLVEQGRPEEGLDHLAVALARPDVYSARAAKKALSHAGRGDLASTAGKLVAAYETGRGVEDALDMSGAILIGIGRRDMVEILLRGLRRKIGATFTFEKRIAYDNHPLVAAKGVGR